MARLAVWHGLVRTWYSLDLFQPALSRWHTAVAGDYYSGIIIGLSRFVSGVGNVCGAEKIQHVGVY